MALDTTIGSPLSDSMVTVEEADAYIAENFSAADRGYWDAFEVPKKEQLLRVGANVLGYLPFVGTRVYINQAQVFPRDKFPGIPAVIKNAQIEFTMNVALRAEMAQPGVATGAESNSKINSVSLAGIISVAFDTEGDYSGSLMDQLVRNINMATFAGLRPYLTAVRGRVIGSSSKYVPIEFTG